MIKKTFITLLVISLLLEAMLTFLCFFMPGKALEQMKMVYSDVYAFPLYLIGWFLLLTTAFIALFLFAVIKNNQQYNNGLYILCFWWIGIGIGIYCFSGLTTNLLTDTLKGVILLVLTYLNNKQQLALK
ncbi:MAG: hypothetical protein ABI685_05845 [Ferruginibacter sp.]